MALILVPSVGAPIFQTWGKSVADLLNAPKRFSVWRTATQALATDGANAVTFTAKDDPAGMVNAGFNFLAPGTGVVVFSATLVFGFSGTAGTVTAYAALLGGSTELRRGSQIQANSGNIPQFGSALSGIVPVTAGTVYSLQAFASGAGVSKSIFGGPSLCYLEGVYIGASG